jgi:ketosteroid isomerase-like protein
MIDIQAEKAEIERMIERVEAAENRHDVDAMLEDMIDDPLLHLCGVPPVQGQDAVRQLYHGFFEIFVSTHITSQRIHISASGDVAWDQGSYVNELRGPDGHTQEEGKYLGVYHKVDGKWKGAVFCITPNG